MGVTETDVTETDENIPSLMSNLTFAFVTEIHDDLALTVRLSGEVPRGDSRLRKLRLGNIDVVGDEKIAHKALTKKVKKSLVLLRFAPDAEQMRFKDANPSEGANTSL